MTKIIKKSLCLLLTAAILLTSQAVIFAEDEQVFMDDHMKGILEVLRLFGIIPDYYDYNTDLTEDISRANFVDAVGKLINAETTNTETYYYDVPNTHYAFSAITVLTDMGIIGGVGDKRFAPDEPVNANAACKILVSLLGYNTHAEYDGGYPNGYIKVAKKIGLIDSSFKGSENLTRGDMLSLLYEALTVPMYVPTSFSPDGDVYFADENTTLTSLYKGIRHGEGIVYASDLVSIKSKKKINKPEQVIIGDYIYDSEISLIEFLDEDVKFFYKDDKVAETKTVVWAVPSEKTETIKVDWTQKPHFDKNSFTYSYLDKNDRQKSVRIERSATVVLNGKLVKTGISDALNLPRCSVKLIEVDGKIDVVVARAYENIFVDSLEPVSKTVIDASYKTLSLHEKDYDHMIIKNQGGAVVDFDAVQIGNVLSYYKSIDEKYIEVIISTTTADGTVDSFNKKGTETVVSVGGGKYIIPDDVTVADFRVGDVATLYMDSDGFVAYAKFGTNSSFAAYIIDIGKKEATFNDDVTLIKLLREDGKVLILECAKKVKVDRAALEKYADVSAAIPKSEVALINVNADMKILSVDTFKVAEELGETKDNSISKNLDQQNLHYWSGTGTFGNSVADVVNGTVLFNSDTVMFKVPGGDWPNPADEDYTVGKATSLRNETAYTLTTYRTASGPAYEKYVVNVVSYADESGTDNQKTVLVTDVGGAIAEDDEVIECIYGWTNSGEVAIPYKGRAKTAAGNLTSGMIIKISMSVSGYGVNFEEVYSPGAADISYTKPTFSGNNSIQVGYVKNVKGNLMEIVTETKDSSGIITATQTSVVAQAGNVLIYDKIDADNPVTLGSFAAAKTLAKDGVNRSDVVLVRNLYGYSAPVLTVIYK